MSPDRVLEPIEQESVEEVSLAEAVYERVLEGIISGTLPSGEILSEVALARQLNVSRTPVHDALRQLAKDGLVEQSTGRRARVTSFTRDDMFEIFEIRKFLEGPAAELAAGRMDQRDWAPLDALADALVRSRGAPDWLSQWAKFDETFHRTIAQSSGNKRLAVDIGRYNLLHRGFNKMRTNPDILQEALAEHLAILTALKARHGAEARRLMVSHIAHWQDHFIRTF